MTDSIVRSGTGPERQHPFDSPLRPLPPRVAVILRPELASLCDEIMAEVCRTVPAFAAGVRGEHSGAVRSTVEHTMRAFLDGIVTPCASTHDRDELFRTLGRLQAGSATGLTRLDSAVRVGVRVFWRRAIAVAHRYDFPASVQSSLADLLFSYVEELSAVSREGYLEARRETPDDGERHRRRLARELLDGRADDAALGRYAEAARWPLPQRIVAVAIDPAAHIDAAALPDGALIGQSGGRTIVLVPGDELVGTLADVRAAAGRAQVAVGPPVALGAVRHSARWAVRALAMAERGLLDTDDGLVDAGRNLLPIWLSTDPALARTICETNLAALDPLTEQQRARMTETLYWWLVHNGNAGLMGDDLGIHPQTVRYRMRGLESVLGDRLDDPEWRISTELALRATRTVTGDIRVASVTSGPRALPGNVGEVCAG